MANIKLSVVIPLYNKIETIAETIVALLHQTVPVDEIIIVNDGSTDGSLMQVKELAGLYPQAPIKIFEQNNKGVSAARNKGVSFARNEFVCLLDADDVWKPWFSEKMIALITDYPDADLYCLGHEIVRNHQKAIQPRHGCAEGYRGYVNDFFKASQYGSVAKSSKICVRKTALTSFGGFPENVVAGEDLFVWIKLALKGKVACDTFLCCSVYQFEDESRGIRRGSVPYPVLYYGKNEHQRELSFHAKNYIAVIAIRHVAAAILAKDYRLAGKRWGAFRRYSFIRSIFPFYIIYMIKR